MASPAQIAANRLNAQRSTGPITAEGKAASSRNSQKFALTAVLPTLSFEDDDDYIEFFHSLVDELKPTDNLEFTLIQKMASHHWCVQRAGLAQDLCFGNELPTIADQQERKFALYMRYQTMHERGFYKAQQELMKLQAARQAEASVRALRQGRRFLQDLQIKLNQSKLNQQPAVPSKPSAPPQPSSDSTPAVVVGTPVAAPVTVPVAA